MTVKKNPFRSLQQIHRVLLLGQILFTVIAFILVNTLFTKSSDDKLDRILQVVSLLISVTALVIGSQQFKKKLLQARRNNLSPAERMDKYRSACIVQWALLEAASLFCIVAYIITHNLSFIALTIFLLFIFGGMNPFKNKVMLQLGLTGQDAESLYAE